MTTFSILLPVYNGGELLKQCIQSIFDQTYTDFKIHVLDSGSNDGTLEWLRSLDDRRIEIHPSDVLLSIEDNWLRIKNIQKCEYMTLIGHDDVLEPFYLQEMAALITKYPGASLYQSRYDFIDEMGVTHSSSRILPEQLKVTDFLQRLLARELDTMGTGYMMRSADYDRLGGIPSSFPNLLFADHALWISLCGQSYMAYTSRICFRYRVHASTSARTNGYIYQQAFFQFLDFLHQYEMRHPVIRDVLQRELPGYVAFFCQALSFKLLRLPLPLRKGMRVRELKSYCRKYLGKISGDNGRILNTFYIYLAAIIDSNCFTRMVFLLFKKIYPKPILRQ